MKTNVYVFLSVTALLFATVGTTQAEVLFEDDFNSGLTAGSIVGQGDWISSGITGWIDAHVAPVGIGSSLGLTTDSADGTATSAAKLYFDTPLEFTSANTEVTFSYWFKTVPYDEVWAVAGMMWDGSAEHHATFGVREKDYWNVIKTHFRDGDGTMLYGDSLSTNAWYEFKIAMDFSVEGGQMTFFYRNDTANETEFTADGTFTDYNMDLTPTNGVYKSNGLLSFLKSNLSSDPQQTVIDNLSISQIPEPSTLALLGAGLIGLLAYAWRKRK